jgi:hypothetical protein
MIIDASLDAVIGRLPAGVRIVRDEREFIILEIRLASSSPATVQRVCVVPDKARDLRVLWVLGTLALLNRAACSSLVGLAYDKGRLQSWWLNTPLLAAAGARSLTEAADAALAHEDTWEVLPPIFVPPKADGTANVDALPTDDLLSKVAPKSVALGRTRS